MIKDPVSKCGGFAGEARVQSADHCLGAQKKAWAQPLAPHTINLPWWHILKSLTLERQEDQFKVIPSYTDIMGLTQSSTRKVARTLATDAHRHEGCAFKRTRTHTIELCSSAVWTGHPVALSPWMCAALIARRTSFHGDWLHEFLIHVSLILFFACLSLGFFKPVS